MARTNMGKNLGHMIDTDLLQKDSIIIDGGVCIGEFIHELANLTDISQFTIIGFEPSKTNIESLAETFKGSHVQIEAKAIVGKNFPDKTLFYEYKNAGLEEWGNVIDYHGPAARARGAKEVTYLVETVTIEKIFSIYNIPRIDYLKLDIEGAEFDIVRTMTQEIANKVYQISMEVHDEEQNPSRSRAASVNLLNDGLVKLGYETHFEKGELYGYRK
jgi:FkbM family methyltransferase